MSAHTPGPVIRVSLTVGGKTYAQDIEVNMEGLAASILDHALKFTAANDRGDAASAEYDNAETDEERAAAASTGDAADVEYNNEKASLFELCRLMAAARAKVAQDLAFAAIAKATGAA